MYQIVPQDGILSKSSEPKLPVATDCLGEQSPATVGQNRPVPVLKSPPGSRHSRPALSWCQFSAFHLGGLLPN
jgi:hypothetical protein